MSDSVRLVREANIAQLSVRKRSGQVVDYQRQKITQAVLLCLVNDCARKHDEATKALAAKVTGRVEKLVKKMSGPVDVETIQDLVEQALLVLGERDAARQYILYRDERAKLRAASSVSPEEVEAIASDSQYFPTELSRFQHYNKYARFLPELHRRETVVATVKRDMDFFQWHLARHQMPLLTAAEYDMLSQAILQAEAAPSMRLMQMAGPAAMRCSAHIYNCLRRDTPFITEHGVKRFCDYRDGEETTVLTHTGQWRKAKVRCYGVQTLQPVTISRGRTECTVWATRDHRWLLADGTETTALRDGQRLLKPPQPFTAWQYEEASPTQRMYWAFGFVYGDGTLVKNSVGEYAYSMVRLCGDKARFLERFQELGFAWSKPESWGGEAVAYTGTYLKTLPTIEKDGIENVRAFVWGLLSADGHKQSCNASASPFRGIQVTGDEAINFVRTVFPVVGAYITREVDMTGEQTNYGIRPPTVHFALTCAFGDASNSNYSVRTWGDATVQEDVWCLEVEEDHSFVLPNGIVTGNCCYAAISDFDYMAEILYLSMCGTGNGFSCEGQYVHQLPQIKFRRQRATPDTFRIPDTTEGWCDSVKHLAYRLADGHDVNMVYDDIRPAGTRLQTKGGTASGPQVLMDLHNAMRRIFQAQEGLRLNDIDVHDIMCYIGKVGQLGNVRRGAEISLSDLSSRVMAEAKQGKFWLDPLTQQRTVANNSAVYNHKPSPEAFMAEWLQLVKSKAGERGIFNRGSVWLQIPERRRALYQNTEEQVAWGLNPCQPASATVLTPQGIGTIGGLEVGQEIWTGRRFSRVMRKVYTGVKPVYRYQTTAGFFLGTQDHRVVSDGVKVRVADAETIDRCTGPVPVSEPLDARDVLDGLLIGDGSVHKASNDLVHLYIGEKDGDVLAAFQTQLTHRPGIKDTAYAVSGHTVTAEELPMTYLRAVPARFKYGSSLKVRGFLRGLFSANGSICGGRITLKAASFQVISDVQEMLSSIGIPSYYTTNAAHPVTFTNGTYTCRQSYDLNITTGRGIFRREIGFIQRYKQTAVEALGPENPRKGSFEVVKTALVGDEPVWDITVEADEHTYWTGGLLVSNCGEVLLYPTGQMCNLSQAICRPNDTPQSLLRKVELAAIFGTIQSTMTDFNYLRPVWKENCERERLLGVDLGGALDCPLLRRESAEQPRLLQQLRERVVQTNRLWAQRLGISPSTAATVIKPGGNSGARWNVGQSMSGWLSQYMIRFVEVSNLDPMCKFLKDAGVYHEVCYRDPSTTVFGFPLEAPAGAQIVADLVVDAAGKVIETRPRRSALDQLESWLSFKRNYTEHNPSVTIYVADHEWLQVGSWVYDHWDDVGGLAFLPLDGHIYPQAPFTPVTEKAYRDFVARFPDRIPWEKLSRYEDGRDHRDGEAACSSDKCVFNPARR